MKTLVKLAEKLNMKLQKLYFRGNGITNTGYCLYSENKELNTGYSLDINGKTYPECIEFEPAHRCSGKIWLIHDHRETRQSYQELKPHQFKKLL